MLTYAPPVERVEGLGVVDAPLLDGIGLARVGVHPDEDGGPAGVAVAPGGVLRGVVVDRAVDGVQVHPVRLPGDVTERSGRTTQHYVLLISVPLTPLSVYLFGAVIGFLWLGTVPLTSGVIAQVFGVRYLSTLSGIAFLFHQIGSFFGAGIGGYLFDVTGSYRLMWLLTIGMGVLARSSISRSTIGRSRASTAPLQPERGNAACDEHGAGNARLAEPSCNGTGADQRGEYHRGLAQREPPQSARASSPIALSHRRTRSARPLPCMSAIAAANAAIRRRRGVRGQWRGWAADRAETATGNSSTDAPRGACRNRRPAYTRR